ncbi:hypothetical protein ACFE04_023019 [Oxalis oulophora]
MALHLRYEMDMLPFSSCTHGCTKEESQVNKEDNSAVAEASNPTIKDKPSSPAAATTSPILTNLPSASKKRKEKSRIKKIKIKKKYKGDSATTLAMSIEPSTPTLWAKAQSLELISSVFVVENLETKDNLENYVSLVAAFPQQGEMTATFPPPPPVFALQKEQGKKTLAFSAPSLALSLQQGMISLDIIRITGGEANESLHALLEEAIPVITLPTSSSHVRTITDEVSEAYMPRLAYNEMAAT